MFQQSLKKISALALGLLLPNVTSADELEDLLKPSTDPASLVDISATTAWDRVVGAFGKNDLKKAREQGQAFLDGNFRPSPYQLLGVKVMMGLADAEHPVATHDATLTAEQGNVASERNQLTAKYAQLQENVRVANAQINKLTNNRKQAVQAGTAAYQECMRCDAIIMQATAGIEAMKPAIESNKRKSAAVNLRANDKLKADTLQLLDMLTQAGEVDAAFAITSVYIRVVGSDLEIAKKQQDVVRLQITQQKAKKIVEVIEGKQKALVMEKLFWGAETIGRQSLSKVQQSNDPDLTKLVASSLDLDLLAVRATIVKADSEAASIALLSKSDSRKAETKLQAFRSTYPDYPAVENLAMAVGGDRSHEVKDKMSVSIKDIEMLAETDVEKASEILAKFDQQDIDPVERLGLEARISTARAKIITGSIQRMNISLEQVKAILGGEVHELILNSRERLKSDKDGKAKATLTTSLTDKINKSADLPEARATLEGLAATITQIELLKPTSAQNLEMTGIKTEVSLLRTAIK